MKNKYQFTVGYDVNVTYTLRDQIVQEIEKNVLQFKSIIDNDPDSPDYLTVIDNIKNEAVYGRFWRKIYFVLFHFYLIAFFFLFSFFIYCFHPCRPHILISLFCAVTL